MLCFTITHQVAGSGGTVAHGFDGGGIVGALHRGWVFPVGKGVEDSAHLAQLIGQAVHWALGQLSDGINAKAVQLPFGGRADVQQAAHRQGVGDLFVIVCLNAGDGIRLLVVIAQFGCNFVVGHTDAGGAASLRQHRNS